MKYRIQNGVVRETICGESLLISTKEARERCPYLTQLDESSAFIWSMIEEGTDSQDMINRIIQKYDVDEKEAEEGLMSFLDAMEERHYIIREA